MADDELRRILPDLREFVSTPGSIKILQKLVLAYGFSGKLRRTAIVGDSADGILEVIQASVGEAKAKQSLSTPLIPIDEIPYALPEGWRWVRLSAVCTHIVDCLHRTPTYSASGYPAIRTNDILPGKL